MKNKPLSKSIIEIIISASPWLMIIAALLFAIFLSSCAVNPLLKPDNGHKITFVTPDYIYTGTYQEPKQDSIVNYWGTKYCAGDIVYYTKTLGGLR